jgi:nitrous oxidase accessory protein
MINSAAKSKIASVAAPYPEKGHLPAWGLLLLPLCLLLLLGGEAAAATIEVRPGGPIKSVEEAILKAKAHDRILVYPGTYQEHSILIDKPLALIGVDQPVLDANFKGSALLIGANGVTVEGFTIQNIEVSYIRDHAAIRIIRSRHCTLRNNRIFNSFFGIYLENSDSCTVKGNEIRGQAVQESSSGNAIHLWYSNANRIENNLVTGHRDGIYLEFVQGSTISRNQSTGNLRYGLHFMFSNDNVYQGNVFKKNGAGVAVMYSRNIEMTGNTFEENWGPSAFGILLKDITDSRIAQNVFRQNTVAVHAEGCSRIHVAQNEFRENGWAVRIMGSSNEVNFDQNNFLGNTMEVATSSNYSSDNAFTRNYWSSYTGYDLDRDGVGDVPHKPVKLFSYLMESYPTSMVLLRSLFLDLLELAEKVAPALTPANLADHRPAMKVNRW